MENVYHLEVLPYSHGIYKVKVEMADGKRVTLVVTDMEIIDAWKEGNKDPLHNHVKSRLGL